MYIISVEGQEKKGAFTVLDEDGEQVLYIFEEEDDALRYSMQLEDIGYPKMKIMEIDDDLMLKTCEMYGQRYAVISRYDIVIPPDSDIPFSEEDLYS